MHNVVTSNWHHSLWQMMTVRKWSGTWQRRSQFGGDPDQGGSQSAGVHIFLWRCCPFGVALQCRDVGGYQPHGPSLWGFQDQVAWRLMGQKTQWRLYRMWEYTSAEAAREDAGFEPMETYIRQRQNVAAHYIVTWPILNLWKVAERNRRAWVVMRWWEKAGLYLERERETAAAADEAD